LGDISVAEAIKEIFTKFIILDYSFNSRINMLNRILKKRMFKYGCLGGGTLIFAPLDSEWSLSLGKLINNRVDLLFTLGTGVRPPDFFNDIDNFTVFKWIEYLKKFRVISVQGNLSRQILKEYGLEKVEVVGDPVLIYCRDKILSKKYIKSIGINISQNHQFYGDKNKFLNTMKKFIKMLIDEKWQITFFPCCKEDVRPSLEICKEIKKDLKIFKNYQNIYSFMERVEKQDIFIGIKLHSVVSAFCTYTPALMIAYQPKGFDFMETMSMSEFVFRSDKVEVGSLIERVNYLYNHIKEIQHRQYHTCQKFKQRLLKFRDQVCSLVGS